MFRRAAILMFVCATACALSAHTVPTLVVEAEFNNARQSDIRVNIDPRLFLAAQPTTIPPMPATWWLEQDEPAQTKTKADAISFVEKTLGFTIGETGLRGGWKVAAIDSATAFPLSAESAEVHLLAERQQQLPANPGVFKVTVSNDCSVGVILLNSVEGKPERHPQSLFPGETSRDFAVPQLESSAATVAAAPSTEVNHEKTEVRLVSPVQLMLLLALAAVLLGLLWTRRRR